MPAYSKHDVPKTLCTLPEVAAMFRRSERTVERHLAAGTFPCPPLAWARRLGWLLWKRAEVEAFLAAGNRAEPPPAAVNLPARPETPPG